MPPPFVLHAHGSSAERTASLRATLAAAPLASPQPLRLAAADDAPPAFDAATYFAALKSERVGATLLAFAELPSTQTLMADNVDALPDGAVCVADVQVSGRGRGGNTWASPPGCLMYSFNTRIVDGRTLPFLQYVVTLAVVEAVQDAARAALLAAGVAESALELPEAAGSPPPPAGTSRRCVDVRIKWPNDVYGGGLKLGGVLCGSTHAGGAFRVTVGAGLNVSNAQPTTCLDALVAAAAAARGAARTPPPLCGAALLAGALSRYAALEHVFVAAGFAPLEAAYLHHWLHTGQRVSLEEAGPPGAPARLVPLTVRGLTPGGYLLAQDDDGERFELCPDGNSLDFFKGLVRKKLPR